MVLHSGKQCINLSYTLSYGGDSSVVVLRVNRL